MAQEPLPTLGLPKHQDLTDQAKRYKDLQLKRLAAGREEKVEKDKLIDMMHVHKLEVYNDPDEDVLISLESEETLKVKIGKDAAGDSNGA